MIFKICVDALLNPNVGGYIDDFNKIKEVLRIFKLTREKLINPQSSESSIQSVVFDAGRYVVIFQFNKELTSGKMTFINYVTSIENHFNSFADCFSNPKALSEFHKTQEYIKLKSQDQLNQIDLTLC
jgi:hypothetical protein